MVKKKTHKVIPLGLLPLDDCELVWNITDACATISLSNGRDTDGEVKAIKWDNLHSSLSIFLPGHLSG